MNFSASSTDAPRLTTPNKRLMDLDTLRMICFSIRFFLHLLLVDL